MPEKNKVVLLGAYGVGKTCILRRFAEGAFESKHTPTIGVDFQNKTVQVGTEAIKLQIWDSAGQERFSAIAPAYFRVREPPACFRKMPYNAARVGHCGAHEYCAFRRDRKVSWWFTT
jgi:hypothetical protein